MVIKSIPICLFELAHVDMIYTYFYFYVVEIKNDTFIIAIHKYNMINYKSFFFN